MKALAVMELLISAHNATRRGGEAGRVSARCRAGLLGLLAGFPLIAGNEPAGDERAEDLLVKRMNRFAETYRQFAERHNRGVFDAALAKKLSQEWRKVEASGEWPRPPATADREQK
jgi:hypothetical protein